MTRVMKPCPFCGFDEVYVRTGPETEVYCQNCTALGPLVHSYKTQDAATDKAIELWNRRVINTREIRNAALREAAELWMSDVVRKSILDLID